MDQTPPRRRQPGPMTDVSSDIPPPRRALIEEMRRGRARTGRSLQGLATEMYTSKATVSRWLGGKADPTRKQAQQWAELCGTDPEVIGDLWDAAYESAEPFIPPAPLTPPAPTSPPMARTRLPRWIVPVAALVVASVGLLVWTITRDETAGPACAQPVTGPATVQPTPNSAAGVTFCPVEINDGQLPIDGPFRLSGQVLGPLDVRQRMVLLVASDPSTCDALGNEAPDAQMYIGKAQIGSPDGSWSYIDTLGYDEAVTYARNFVYVMAPNNEVLNEIRNDKDHYLATGGDEDAYAGLRELPTGALVVAHFDVPAGIYDGKPGKCKPV